MVAHAGWGLKISYQHRCTLPITTNIKTATIQQLLPLDLSFETGIDFDTVLQRCSTCTKKSGVNKMVECFGFPVAGHMSIDPAEVAALIPHFRDNVEAAVIKVRQLDGVHAPPVNKGVTIYLDADTERSSDVYQVPMKHYAEIIPRDISRISIVVPDRCGKCRDLSALTKDFFHSMYPTATIDVEIVAGSAVSYARVMEAPFHICSPSVLCVLPSLFKGLSHSSHLIASHELYPWLPFLAEKTEAQLGKSIFLRHNLQMLPVPNSLEEMKPFLFQPANANSKVCMQLRGRLGGWTQDLGYAETAQYVTPLQRFMNGVDFEPTLEMPYRLATTYRWIDDLCQVEVLQRGGLCGATKSLGITRIYFVGDSLGMQMAQSLWKLLGNEDEPYIMKRNVTHHRYQWNRTVDCPNQHHFDIVYTRNDMLDDNDETDLPQRAGDKDYNCGSTEFCMPWIRSFAEYDDTGTLLIANVGPHIHEVDQYRKLVDDFLGFVDAYQKPNDVVMFRTTPPRHNNCQDPNVAPLRSYDEYLDKHFIADYKSYQIFPIYNRIAEQGVRKKHRDNLQILDVVPMTILRPDGHTSGPQKCADCNAKDCLHYILPGPPDWWNHLMYSNLANMAKVRQTPALGAVLAAHR